MEKRQQQGISGKKKSEGQEDIFASLVSFKSARQTPTLSLQEQQRQQATSTPSGSSWGASELDLLGSRASSARIDTPEYTDEGKNHQVEDDPLAIFSTPPPPPPPQPNNQGETNATIDDEDAEIMAGFHNVGPEPVVVEEKASNDGAVAELVDMGFSTDQAIDALDHSDHTVQGAVDYILKEAHRKSGQKKDERRQQGVPSRKQEVSDQDIIVEELSKMASDFSSQFMSKASSWFQEGRKMVSEAMKDRNEEQFNGNEQPVWMREAELYKRQQQQKQQRAASPSKQERASMTPELLQLERDRPPLPRRRSSQSRDQSARRTRDDSSNLKPSSYKEEKSIRPVTEPTTRTSSRQKQERASPSRPASRLQSSIRSPAPEGNRKSRLLDDDDGEDSMMYRSPNRQASLRERKPPPRPARPVRAKVEISSSAQDKIQAMRESGSEAFKRGDYTEAEQDYTKGLQVAPKEHLLRVMLLSNRAAALLKNGEPKRALSDCEEGLKIIGPSKGEKELLGDKPLKMFWIKLTQRKAESLEQLERYEKSYDAYSELIGSGNADKIALDGKRRCENHMGRTQTSSSNGKKQGVAPAPRPRPPPKVTKQDTARPPSEAVKKLQQAKQEQESIEAEKFALYDTVEARIIQWKGGKEDNLRALLGSLQDILTGWTKISMAELIAPKKVKIAYMKAVSRTHPDKISVNASTQDRMIAQAVFVTINKAWDDFRQSNNV